MGKECCSIDNNKSDVKEHHNHNHSQDNSDGHSHEHSHDSAESSLKLFLPALISFFILALGLLFDYYLKPDWFKENLRLIWYLAAYLPVGFPVLKDAWQSIRNGDFFSEFFLMGIATIGAFAIGEYPEGVAVMLFYSVGEAFQGMAVSRAKSNIKNLLDQRPDEVSVLQDGKFKIVDAKSVNPKQIIQLKPGEKLALDGILISEKGSFNTAALTGESKPASKKNGEIVLAGMINLNTVVEVEVTALFQDSKLSKILDLVQNASSQKAPTELFIRKFAKIYTPIVVFLAVGILLLPYFFTSNYSFSEWLYRALVFLVISCPCALVISIPLGYFGGIGAASKNGILVKGSNYLDVLSEITHVIMDKTGTLTEGIFKVNSVAIEPPFNENEILQLLNVIESKSTHPIATAVHQYVGEIDSNLNFDSIEEIPGHGLKGIINGKEFLAGNFKLLDKFSIKYSIIDEAVAETLIAIAYDGKFAGFITISDSIKTDSKSAISQLQKLGISTVMLSGDKSSVVREVATNLGIVSYFGDLLPEDKVEKLKSFRSGKSKIAFVGDGVNDAPVLALSDVGLAMGGLGSDAAIETADVVIQDDKPSKIPIAIKIGKETKKIVWQNIILAFAVKAIVLILGAGGLATMWEAVFADVGVALLAILNAVRIQSKNFK